MYFFTFRRTVSINWASMISRDFFSIIETYCASGASNILDDFDLLIDALFFFWYVLATDEADITTLGVSSEIGYIRDCQYLKPSIHHPDSY